MDCKADLPSGGPQHFAVPKKSAQRPSAKKVKPPPSRALILLAKNLAALRDSHADLTSQTLIGKKASIDQRTVGRIMNMEHEPTLGQVDKLAAAFGLAAWQLLVDKFNPTNEATLALPGRREQAFYDKLTSTREAIDGVLREAGNTDHGDLVP